MESSAEANRILRTRLRQQEVVADVGQQALETDDIDRLTHDASTAVAETLDTEYANVLELLPHGDEVVLREGVGWHDGLVGTATVPTGPDSHVGYTLRSETPIVVDDLRTEARFSGSQLLTDHDVLSGICVVIGSAEDPWGVLGTHTTTHREFTEYDATFVQNVANVLAAAIDRVETEQRLCERTGTRQDLRESDRPFRQLAEHLDQVVWMTTAGGEILYVNPAFEDVWGRDRDFLSDDAGSFIETVHPDDREMVLEAFETQVRDEYEVEYRIVRPDGEVRWIHDRATPIFDEDGEVSRIVGDANDVTERMEHERDLARFERAVESSGHSIHMSTLDQKITYVNPAFEETTGYDAEEVIGKNPSILESGEHDDAYYSALRETIRAGDVWEEEIIDRRKDGELYHAEQTIAPVTDECGDIDRFVAVQNEITERKEYQRQLEESNERLEQFAYAASHDLQEPLRMISSYLRLIDRRYSDAFDEDGEEFLEYAVDGADRMRSMIDGLLEYSRVETQGDEFEQIDLVEVFEDACDNLRVKIEECDAEITAASLPRVEGDGGQLRQVFQNLILNALEYTDDDPPRVHVDVERNGMAWTVSVADDGLGIATDDQERIFDVFQRAHDNREYSGTGIGLALCERIVERHGGELWVDSEPGEGATFSFTLSAVQQEPDD